LAENITMESVILRRNPYHGLKASEHRPLRNPTLQDLRNLYDSLQRAEYWIPRSAEDEAAIQAYKQQLLSEGRSIEDEIRQLAGDSGFVLMENKFPYAVQDARHYVLWILDGDVLEDAEQYICNFLESQQICPDETVCYENNIAYQTASGIPHFHIYVPQP